MIPRYRKMVHWSEEDVEFVATAPDFPGLSALARTEEKALLELSGVLEAVIAEYRAEGWPLPEPSRVPMKIEQSGQLRLRLPSRLHALAVEQAEQQGVSLNSLLLSFVAFGLGAGAPKVRVGRPTPAKPSARPTKVQRSR